MKHKRASGILLHVSSLPGPYGIGDFGPGAWQFSDWLRAAGQRWWQVLPLCPTDPFYASSPYRSVSAFALNPLFISPDLLEREGLVTAGECRPRPSFRPARADYAETAAWRHKLLNRAAERLRPGAALSRFCRVQRDWLDDYCLFTVLKELHEGQAWTDWPAGLRDRRPAELRKVQREFALELERARRIQFLAWTQWQDLRRYARRQGIGIIGDLPIYVDHDSSDAWTNRKLFQLDRLGRPKSAAGVPPDYFSKTGQLWGNPVYDWPAHQRTRFAWWVSRCRHALAQFDLVRIDHFRGLVAGWQVAVDAADARKGKWVKAPADKLLAALKHSFRQMPFIAEDLGHITPDVTALREKYGLPGMKVLQFCFGSEPAPTVEDVAGEDTFLYTGTHDNNTTPGWLRSEANATEKRRVAEFLGHSIRTSSFGFDLAGAALRSRAAVVVTPVQDLLNLGSDARMNTPATVEGNWEWRLAARQLSDALARRLGRVVEETGRLP